MWSKIIIFLLFLQLTFTFDLPQKCISDLKINNDHYNVSQTYNIGDGETYPTDAHYDAYGNLFYVQTHQNDEGYHYNIYLIKPKTSQPQKVNGLPTDLSYSIAVDKKHTQVFFGTGRGLYTFNYETETASVVFNSTEQLEMVFIDKNSNKYIIENINGVEEFYVLDGQKKIRCQALEALNEMAIDEDNNFYFIRDNKLHVLKSTHSAPTEIGNVNYNGMAQISFQKDNVFVANSNKLAYFHENDTGNLKVIDNVAGNVTAIAFEKEGSFVIGIKGKILKYKKNECYLRKNNRVVDEYSNK